MSKSNMFYTGQTDIDVGALRNALCNCKTIVKRNKVETYKHTRKVIIMNYELKP